MDLIFTSIISPNKLAGIVACREDGNGIGALRTLTSADGGTIQERLEAQDEAARWLSYSLLSGTPFRNCLTSMEVRSLVPNQAGLECSACFETDGIPESGAGQMLVGALSKLPGVEAAYREYDLKPGPF